MQEPEDIDPNFHFAAQLAMYYHFPDPGPSADAVGAVVSIMPSIEHLPPLDPRRWNGTFKYEVHQPAHPNPSLRGQIYVSDLTLKRYGSGFDVEAADFGDGGTAYLFVQPDPIAPKGRFSWQCG